MGRSMRICSGRTWRGWLRLLPAVMALHVAKADSAGEAIEDSMTLPPTSSPTAPWGTNARASELNERGKYDAPVTRPSKYVYRGGYADDAPKSPVLTKSDNPFESTMDAPSGIKHPNEGGLVSAVPGHLMLKVHKA